MNFLILSENSNGTWPHLHFRSMGSFELRRRIELKGHSAKIIDWFTHWTIDELKKVIIDTATDDFVIAISTPFNTVDVHKIKPLLEWARHKYPKLKIIHGGSRNYDDSLSGLVDVFFLGRSMEMFDAWLEGKDLSRYTANASPLVLVNNNFDEMIDSPVIPVLKDEDGLTKKDIVGFEIGVGCKFNCTFCNYELRNAKITKLANPYDLKQYFEYTNGKYGITNYFASDDTLNETDEKLEIVAEAMSGLSFHPEITAYARLDIITGRKQQLDLLNKIQFRSLFFGIESFNPEASKAVRKKSGLGNTYETLKQIRDTCPDTYTVGGMIIGLNKDTEESIIESTNKVINEKLLRSFQFAPLSITKPQGIIGADFYSDLDKEPEKFDYKIIDVVEFHHDNKNMASYAWQSDWTNTTKASKLTDYLYEYCRGKIDTINHLEYAGLHALGVYDQSIKYEAIRNKSYAYSQALKNSYIKQQLSLLKR